VEDNQTDVFVIVEVLRECGIEYRLQVARDGENARAVLGLSRSDGEPTCPDLLLLDLNLPKLSGIDLLAELRASSRHRHIPVVVVTSSDSKSDREAIGALNPSAYFRKPSNLSDFMQLAGLIREALQGKSGPDA
jgi:chemotaxis family two-component system response regulator Rcp1